MVLHVRFFPKLDLNIACIKANEKEKKKGKRHTKAYTDNETKAWITDQVTPTPTKINVK